MEAAQKGDASEDDQDTPCNQCRARHSKPGNEMLLVRVHISQ